MRCVTRPHHHGEDDGGACRLDGPEDDKAAELDRGEDVDLPQRDVAQVDQVRLVLGRHAEQLDPIEELRDGEELELCRQKRTPGQTDRWTWMPFSEDTPM